MRVTRRTESKGENGAATGRGHRRLAAGLLAASLTVGGLVTAPAALAAPAQPAPPAQVCSILFRAADRFGSIPQIRVIIFRQLVRFGCISRG